MAEINKREADDVPEVEAPVSSDPKKIEKDAKDYVLAMRQQMAVRGTNDMEYGAIDKIVKDLEEGVITPEEARKKAFDMNENKQDWR